MAEQNRKLHTHNNHCEQLVNPHWGLCDHSHNMLPFKAKQKSLIMKKMSSKERKDCP